MAVFLYFLSLFIFATCYTYQTSWNPDYNNYPQPTPQEIMVEVINNLGLHLLAIHNENNDNNIAISPYGAASVLVALSEGVRGEAVREIHGAAQIPRDISIIRIGLRDIHRHLKSYFIPKEGFLAGLTLSHDNVTLRQEYEKILRFYGYDIESFNSALYPDPESTQSPLSNTDLPETATVNGEPKEEVTSVDEMSTVKTTTAQTTSKHDENAETTIFESVKTTTVGVRDETTQMYTTERATTFKMNPPKDVEEISKSPTTITTSQKITTEVKPSTPESANFITTSQKVATEVELSTPESTIMTTSQGVSPGVEPLTPESSTISTSQKVSAATIPTTPETTTVLTSQKPLAETKLPTPESNAEDFTSTESTKVFTSAPIPTTKSDFLIAATESQESTVPPPPTTYFGPETVSQEMSTLFPPLGSRESTVSPPPTTSFEPETVSREMSTLPSSTVGTTEEKSELSDVATSTRETITENVTFGPTEMLLAESETRLEMSTMLTTTFETTSDTTPNPNSEVEVLPSTIKSTTLAALETENSNGDDETTQAIKIESRSSPPFNSIPELSLIEKTANFESRKLPDPGPTRDYEYEEEISQIPRSEDNWSSVLQNNVQKRNASRRDIRSVVDYVIARYYDNYNPPPKEEPYKPKQEQTFLVNGKFNEGNISFMSYDTVLPFYYISHLNALAMSFPLDSTKYYLLLLLPIDENGLDKLLCDIKKTTNLKHIIKNLKYTHVKAIIPSFMLKGYVILTPTLQKLGIRSIFEPRHADFSPMTDDKDIYVTNIEQAITVTIRNYVDPNKIQNHRNLYQYGPVEFKADHPFLYFVIDAEIHVTLMAGKVMNPLNSRIR